MVFIESFISFFISTESLSPLSSPNTTELRRLLLNSSPSLLEKKKKKRTVSCYGIFIIQTKRGTVRSKFSSLEQCAEFWSQQCLAHIPHTSWQPNLWHHLRGWAFRYQNKALWSAPKVSCHSENWNISQIQLDPLRSSAIQYRCSEVSLSNNQFFYWLVYLPLDQNTHPLQGLASLDVENVQNFTNCLFSQQSIWHIYMVFQCRTLKLPIIISSILSHFSYIIFPGISYIIFPVYHNYDIGKEISLNIQPFHNNKKKLKFISVNILEL